jgi:hypothetical protein
MMKAPIAFALFAILGAAPLHAQGPAYPTPDNNITRSDDVDPDDAPNLNEEYGRPSNLVPDDGDDFADDNFDDDDDEFVEVPPPVYLDE